MDTKMKIAYFLDGPHVFGGAGTLLLQQATLMSKIYDVLVVIPIDICGSFDKEYAERCEQYGLPYCFLKYSTAANFCDIDYCGAMNSVNDIEGIVKSEKITFFHSSQLNIAVEYVARKLKIPHLMDIYQLREEEFTCCPGDIYPHYHLCDSQLYSERWAQNLKICSRCVRPIALRDEVKSKSLSYKNEIKVLMVGTVCERKNQLAAIKACELCLDKCSMTLTIAGISEGTYFEKCLQYVKEHNLEERIIFKGFLSNVIPLLESCDCVLCTSIDESFPSSIVEALTYDMTVVSTPVAGVPEIFKNRDNAFVSKNFSVNCIAESLMECVSSYENGEIDIIHKNAYETWKNYFARNRIRELINSYYKEIMKQPYTSDGDFAHITPKVNQIVKMLSEVYADCEGMQKRALYHLKLREELKQGKMYLWGAGKMGGYAYRIIKVVCPEIEIISFVDKMKEGTYYGLPIIKPAKMTIHETIFYGIGFIDERESAINYLESKGLELNKQIWIVP